MKELQECCIEFIVPQRDKPKEFGGSTPWCRIEDIQGKYLNGTTSGQYVTDETIKKMNLKVIPKGAVICSCSASLGVQAILTTPCVTNQTFIGIVPKEELDSEFLYYMLKSKTAYFKKIGTGTTIPYISRKKFEQLLVPELSLAEQSQVVEVLRRAEYVIDARKKELKQLDDLIKARFVELFGSIHESTEYPYVAVKDLTDVISGGTPSRDRSEYWDNGTIPWIKTTELQNNVITDADEFITEAGLAGSSAKMVPIGTVLVAMYGQGKTRGMTAYLDIEASTNQACACILPSDKIDSMFMWKYFELSYDKLRSLAQGAGQPNLNGNMIKNFQVLVPPIELQKAYVDFVKQVDKSKVIVQKALDETQTLLDSLMQKYFS